MSAQLYSHKQPAFEAILQYVSSGHGWLLVEGAGAGTGTSFLMKHVYQHLPRLKFQSLYIEAAPTIESAYPISRQLVKMFDTKAILGQRSVFHRAIELLRRYNFSPLYVLCDLSFTVEQSAMVLLKEAEFLNRHCPKHQLRFVFAKNECGLLSLDDNQGAQDKQNEENAEFTEGHTWGLRLRHGGGQIWQVVRIPTPAPEDIQAHLSQCLADERVNYKLDPSFYAWIIEQVGANFSHLGAVVDYVCRQAHNQGLVRHRSCQLDFAFLRHHTQSYLKDSFIPPTAA